MANNTTSLYIDNLSIRLMTTRGKRITKLADMPLDADLSEIENSEVEAKLVEKIKYLFQSNHIGSRKIILGISGLRCLTRPIVLPELPKAMLEEAITREARRVLPVPVEQLYLSWQIMSTSEGKIQAFMVGIPRQIADPIIKIVTEAGFKPYIMDIKPLALARLSRETNAIIIDVQQSEFDIIVLSKGMPQPVRTVPFSKETTSLKERLGIVKDELQRTIQFFNTNNPENKIQPGAALLVSGEIVDESELFDYLGGDLGLKVTPLVSPLKCLKQLDPSHHLVNVGLTLKELVSDASPVTPNFNTLPVPYQPKQVSMNRLMAIPAIGVAVVMIALLATTVQSAAANIDKAQDALDANAVVIEKKNAQKKDLTKNIAAIESKLAALEASRKNYTTALNSLVATGDKMNTDLTTTLNNAVTDLDISRITLGAETISLSGTASGEQQVFQYVRKLTNTERYDEITINSLRPMSDVSENDSMAVSYALSIKLKELTK
jgi:type IV pilus assembly protein PilM